MDSPRYPAEEHTSSLPARSPLYTGSGATGYAGGMRRSIFMTLATLSTAYQFPAALTTPSTGPPNFDSMFMVKGKHHHGLIVDPGAASALSGSETLRRYWHEILEPQGVKLVFEGTQQVFTGVDGQPSPGLGVCPLPISLLGYNNATWRTDVIGDTGSMCPMLLLNCVLVSSRQRSILASWITTMVFWYYTLSLNTVNGQRHTHCFFVYS